MTDNILSLRSIRQSVCNAYYAYYALHRQSSMMSLTMLNTIQHE